MTETKKMKFKRITLRFLKDSKLSESFRQHIAWSVINHLKERAYRWYDVEYLDGTIGQTSFTHFLELKFNKRYNMNIFHYFISYIYAFHKELMNPYHCSNEKFIAACNEKSDINEVLHTVKLKNSEERENPWW